MSIGRFALKTFRNFLKFKTGKVSPLFASYNVTGRCNMRCVYCNWWKMEKLELPTNKALTVIDEVCSLDVSFFDFSGGEPMLRNDLTTLAKKAASHNCLVSINTNATLLKRENASRIADAFDIVVVSIDGPKECHDKIRGVAGAFQRAVESIKVLRSLGVEVGINSVISPYNIDVFPRFIEEIRPIADFLQVQPVHPYPPPSKNKPPIDKVAAIQEYLLDLKKKDPKFLAVPTDFLRGLRLFFEEKTPKICDAGKLYVAIDPAGNLLACAASGDIVLGNLLESSAENILTSDSETTKRAWAKVASCDGCWLECTVGVSVAVRNLKETIQMARLLKGFQCFRA
ncbi:MAG: radical SAM protein [Candidatus Bathyarchaeia archaeon]